MEYDIFKAKFFSFFQNTTSNAVSSGNTACQTSVFIVNLSTSLTSCKNMLETLQKAFRLKVWERVLTNKNVSLEPSCPLPWCGEKFYCLFTTQVDSALARWAGPGAQHAADVLWPPPKGLLVNAPALGRAPQIVLLVEKSNRTYPSTSVSGQIIGT